MKQPTMRRGSDGQATGLLAVIPAVLTIVACNSTVDRSDSTTTLVLPEAWQGSDRAGDVKADPWWEEFADPSLSAAIAEALEANRDLRVSAARLAQAAIGARLAGADLRPSLDVSGNGQRTKQIFVGLPIPGGGIPQSTSTNYGVSLNFAWELDLWGRLAAGEQAAYRDLEAAAADHIAARHSLAAQTAKAWFSWQEARLQGQLARDTVKAYERTEELVQKRFEGGLAPALDLRLTRTELESARAIVAERGEQEERAKNQLILLCGRLPGMAFDAPAFLPATPPDRPVGLPGELLGRRPDLVAAEARLAAADQRLHAARAALYPSLRLSASAGRTSDHTSDLVDADFSIWSIAAGIVQPLYAGGRLREGVNLADAVVDEALAAFEASLLTALTEVETSLGAEEHLALLEEAQQAAKASAREAQRLSDERYRAGLTDLLDVLTAERRALGIESALLSVRRRRLTERIDLHLALGGGFGENTLVAKQEGDR